MWVFFLEEAKEVCFVVFWFVFFLRYPTTISNNFTLYHTFTPHQEVGAPSLAPQKPEKMED